MSEYRVIDDFQVKTDRILSLDRPLEMDAYGKSVYIDGVKYRHILNSVQSWIQLPNVDMSFEGKTVVFK